MPPNYGLYMQCSRAFGDILREYSPLVEQYSIDEYFVDFTNMGRIYADPHPFQIVLESNRTGYPYLPSDVSRYP